MCALPLRSQLIGSIRWLEVVGNGFWELHQYPISEISGKTVEMLKTPFRPKGKEACGGLIFMKLNKKSREINRSLEMVV